MRTDTPVPARSAFVLAVVAGLAVGGCDLRNCALGIANGDCYPPGSPRARFPEDDAVCRSYGLEPGTQDYAICRKTKLHERALTNRATDYGGLQSPLLPDVRPVVPVPPER